VEFGPGMTPAKGRAIRVHCCHSDKRSSHYRLRPNTHPLCRKPNFAWGERPVPGRQSQSSKSSAPPLNCIRISLGRHGPISCEPRIPKSYHLERALLSLTVKGCQKFPVQHQKAPASKETNPVAEPNSTVVLKKKYDCTLKVQARLWGQLLDSRWYQLHQAGSDVI
jgi:hypothetical protein